MEKYDCKNCIHNGKGRVFINRNKKCEHCTVDSKDINGKPSNYKEKGNQIWFLLAKWRCHYDKE